MSTRKEEQNYGVTPINEGINYILAADRASENEIVDNMIKDRRHAVLSTFDDKYIKEFSEDFLMKSDEDTYGRRNAVMSFYPGKINDCAVKREYDHMLVTGRTGSGKTIFVENIINQLILRYARWQVNVNVWDGKCCDFVSTSRGAEFVDIRGVCAMSSESSLVHYLAHRVLCLRSRLDLLNNGGFANIEEYNESMIERQANFPYQVILLEEFAVGLEVREEVQKQIFDFLMELMQNGKKAGIYVILSMQPSEWVVKLYNDYFKQNGYIMATRLNDKESNELFGYEVATEDYVGKYGKVVVRDAAGQIDLMDVPFYADRIIRGICKGELVPMGQKFSAYKLEQLKNMHFGLKGF